MGWFDEALDELAQERHRSILSRLRPSRRPRNDRHDGFLKPDDAAKLMQLPVEEVIEMAQVGLLDAREFGGEALIRPAIVGIGIRS